MGDTGPWYHTLQKRRGKKLVKIRIIKVKIIITIIIIIMIIIMMRIIIEIIIITIIIIIIIIIIIVIIINDICYSALYTYNVQKRFRNKYMIQKTFDQFMF